MKKRLDQIFLVRARVLVGVAAMMIGRFIRRRIFVIAGFSMGLGGIIWWRRDWIQTLDLPFGNEKYVRVLRNVCYSYRVPFSFHVQEGGYICENGEYARETSLGVTLIDVEKAVVGDIAKVFGISVEELSEFTES